MRSSRTLTRALAATAALSTVVLSGTAQAQASPPQWNSATSFTAGGLVRGSDGNYYRAIKNSQNVNPTTDAHSSWELYYIRTNTVLKAGVGGVYSNLKSAWPALGGATIAPAVAVTIQLNAGAATYSETFSSSLSLNHPFGAQISIIGTDASKVTLNFPHVDGFELDSGHSFGAISGIRITGSVGQGAGIRCSGHGTFSNVTAIIDGFGSGIIADDHSQVTAMNSIVKNGSSGAAFADHGSEINIRKTTLSMGPTGYAVVQADNGSVLNLEQAAITTGNSQNGMGIFANKNSTVDARGSTITSCNVGAYANLWAMVDVSDCSVTSCGDIGLDVTGGGHMNATNITFSGNANNTNIPLNTASPDGSLIIKS